MSSPSSADPVSSPSAEPTADAFASIEVRWDTFYRWGPWGLLTLSVFLAAVTRDEFLSRGEQYSAVALCVAAYGLQLWWDRKEQRTVTPVDAVPPPGGALYFWLRTTIAFALTVQGNPLFSIYAILGYFDAGYLLKRRWVRAGLIVTAVSMAGGQSGGLPPPNLLQAGLFAGLLALHVSLVLIFGNLSAKEAERSAARAATIAELERANARLEHAMQENARLQDQLLVQAREAGVGAERRRLAAEIHDTIAQGLTGIVTQLQAATNSTDLDAARGHVDRAAALARYSLGEARRSVQDLSPGALEHDGLPEALKRLVQDWSADSGARAQFTVTGTAEPLHDELEATMLRIAQEALTNAARHAHATRVGVTLSYMDDEVILDIRDDGHGFDLLAQGPRTEAGGFGLSGMRARAERVAGTVEVESEPGAGTAISARVPLVRHD